MSVDRRRRRGEKVQKRYLGIGLKSTSKRLTRSSKHLHDVVLAYPDYGELFEIYTDASTRQLGGVIVQKDRPLAFFARKLSDPQQKYTITELELLSIVELLKEYRGMLWGQRIKVYTEESSQRVAPYLLKRYRKSL